MNDSLELAGALSTLGTSWLTTVGTWADLALPTLLAVVVVVTVARRMSMRAAVGSLIMLAIALGLYWSRFDLAAKFKDEVDNPGTSTSIVPTLPSAPTSGSLGPLNLPLDSRAAGPRDGGAA